VATSTSTSLPSSTTTTSTTLAPPTSTTTTLPPDATFPAGEELLVRQNALGIARLLVMVKDPEIAAATPCDVAGELVLQPLGTDGPVRRFPLDAALWTPIDAKRPERGCRYRRGPVVANVRVKPGKAIKLLAFGRTLGLDLAGDPRPLRVEIRHGEQRYCIEFGGSRGRYIPTRKLVAKDAAPTTACPGSASSSGAFLD
jgi:hypothetical protein